MLATAKSGDFSLMILREFGKLRSFFLGLLSKSGSYQVKN